ncbi:MAG: hypothetical protein M3509_00925, partial [Chloroflexota bacterium]|nr:hypothetical protein [Chloroflexota bacterium]
DYTTPISSQWTRRAAARLLGGGLALLAGGTAVAAPGKQKKPPKKPKFRTITRTFRNDSSIDIRDDTIANPYPSTIKVSGFKQGKLLDVNVKLENLGHGDPSDIDVLLQAPNGRRAIIMSDAGDAFDVTNITITLDDQAAEGLRFASPLSSGRFKPTNFGTVGSGDDAFPPPAPAGDTANVELATFDGINPNGTWRLFVVDDIDEGAGSIGSWALTIKARVRV